MKRLGDVPLTAESLAELRSVLANEEGYVLRLRDVVADAERRFARQRLALVFGVRSDEVTS